MKAVSYLFAATLIIGPALAQHKTDRDTLTGEYRLRYSNVIDTLHVQKLPEGRVKIQLIALLKINPENLRNGEIRATLPLRASTAVYQQDQCRLEFHFAPNRVTIREQNPEACGFGAYVTAQGTYRKTSRKPAFTP